jgi:hypothetical protein
LKKYDIEKAKRKEIKLISAKFILVNRITEIEKINEKMRIKEVALFKLSSLILYSFR